VFGFANEQLVEAARALLPCDAVCRERHPDRRGALVVDSFDRPVLDVVAKPHRSGGDMNPSSLPSRCRPARRAISRASRGYRSRLTRRPTRCRAPRPTRHSVTNRPTRRRVRRSASRPTHRLTRRRARRPASAATRATLGALISLQNLFTREAIRLAELAAQDVAHLVHAESVGRRTGPRVHVQPLIAHAENHGPQAKLVREAQAVPQ